MGGTGAPASDGAQHGREIAKIYCDGLGPTPLGDFVWYDEGENARVGVSPDDFDASPPPVRLWIIARFEQWATMCDPDNVIDFD